jgi:hypothetical protein
VADDQELMTPQDVVRKLLALGREQAEAVRLLKAADLDASKKRHAADVAESKAFLSEEGSMDIRKHAARSDVEVVKLEEEALVAEAYVRHLNKHIKYLESQIEIGRTYGVVVREEMKLAGYQPG